MNKAFSTLAILGLGAVSSATQQPDNNDHIAKLVTMYGDKAVDQQPQTTPEPTTAGLLAAIDEIPGFAPMGGVKGRVHSGGRTKRPKLERRPIGATVAREIDQLIKRV